jgi:hypothetical protein
MHHFCDYAAIRHDNNSLNVNLNKFYHFTERNLFINLQGNCYDVLPAIQFMPPANSPAWARTNQLSAGLAANPWNPYHSVLPYPKTFIQGIKLLHPNE